MGSRKKATLFDSGVWEREKSLPRHSKALIHLSATALGLFFIAILFQFELHGLSGLLIDGMFRLRKGDPHPDIVLIAYDDEARMRYGSGAKIPAEEIALVFETLLEGPPKAVALLATLDERYYSESELQLVTSSLSRLPQAFVGYIDDESLGRSQSAALNLAGRYLPGFVSRDTYSYGADSVSRRAMVTIDGFTTVFAKIACLYRGLAADPVCWTGPRFERLGDTVQAYIDWQGPPGTYKAYSTRAVAERRVPTSQFSGKIVLLGSQLSAKRATDFVLTPYSREPQRTSLLEGAAHGLVTLMRNDGLIKTPKWLNVLVTLIVGLTTLNLALLLPPAKGMLFVALISLVLLSAGFLAFALGGIWVGLSHPLVVACVGYYLVIPYRLVDEYRKRWHYQEKTEIMAQLEQLKSNFLSLVSHDLKTPIARIQGNAELVLNEAASLSDKQRKSLAAILHTTEDLSEYVETVLDLARIESSQVPLQKTTKDINSVVLEVIESKRPLAQEKDIDLEVTLEPIFSFKFDVKLIRRVIANLVENAIKYSPEGSTITLLSREEGNWVQVTVQDRGIGIAPEEQAKVFQKFYRCQNSATRSTKGTGLGLYLAKYFVELHQGLLELKSELGKGSAFTVRLPV